MLVLFFFFLVLIFNTAAYLIVQRGPLSKMQIWIVLSLGLFFNLVLIFELLPKRSGFKN